jgi:hypothetical protein
MSSLWRSDPGRDSVASMTQKLDTARVFERIFQMYRDQFMLLVPTAIAVFLLVAIVVGLLVAAGGPFGGIVALLLAIAVTFLYQGMVVEAARDILDGRRDHTVGSLISSVTPVLAPLVGASLLAGLGIVVGFVLLIVPGLFLLTIWALIAPVVVLERAPAMDSFGRSRALVRGNGWRVFGVLLVLFVLQLLLVSAVQAAFGSISDSFVLYGLADLIVRGLIAPLSALGVAVMYFELKAAHGEAVPGSATYTPPAAQTAQPAPPLGERPPGT